MNPTNHTKGKENKRNFPKNEKSRANPLVSESNRVKEGDTHRDPLAENVKGIARKARSGFANTARSLTSFSMVKLLLVGGVTLGFVAIVFISGAFGSTTVNVTLPLSSGLDSGLVGHWSFDGPDLQQNVTDSSGQGNNGVINGQTSTTTVIGKIGQALDFDGVDDRVIMGNPSSLNPTEAITISAWVKRSRTAKREFFVDKGRFSSATDGQYWLEFQSNNTIRFLLYGAATSNTPGVITATTFADTSQWHHIVGTYDKNTMRIYVDGVAEPNTTAFTESIRTTTFEFVIGNRGVSHDIPFNGSIDDVRIYNRALSADEVKRLYDLGASTKINTPLKTSAPNLESGLVGYWTLDRHDTEQNVVDSSGNGNTGFLQGFVSTTTVAGKIDQALDFDGVDDYVLQDVPTASLGVQASEERTVSAWIKPDVVNVASQYIVNIYINGLNYRLYLVNDEVSAQFSSGYFHTTVNANLVAGRWYNVLFVFNDATNNFDIYVDGQIALDATESVGLSTYYAQGRVSIGAYYSGILFFNGEIDDVRAYNRELSADEIEQLYKFGTPTHINTTISTNPNLENGLVGHWSFDGPDLQQNATDSSGQGNNGFLTGFTSTTTRPGKIGQALDFDGVDDYVDAGQMYNTASPLTISAWIKSDAFKFGVGQAILSNRSSGNKGFTLYTPSGVSDPSGSKASALAFVIQGVVLYSSSLTQPIAGRWEHVAITYSGSTLVFYLNGVQTDSMSTVAMNLGSNMQIGIQAPAYGMPFNGGIDDVRIYNRVLTADEISRLYDLAR